MRPSRLADFGKGFARDHIFWALVLLLVAAFAMGGSARDDATSLIFLRPLAVLLLAVGLAGLTREQMAAFRLPLGLMAALLGLILLHLVPLPPSIWTALPGRELAAQAGAAGEIGDVWRPLALVPWRGWNAFFAMLVPAAALVLAIRCSTEHRRRLVTVVLVLVGASAMVGILQAIGGFQEKFYLYRIANVGAPSGLFANRNHQAALICAALPLLAVYATHAVRANMPKVRLWAAALAGCLLLLVLLATGSRAGLVLAFPALLAAALVYLSSDRGKRPATRSMIWIALGVLGVALLAVVAILWSRADAVDRILNIRADENRFETWGPIAAMIGQYLPFGSGIGSFVEVYKIGEPTALLNQSYLNHAHNDWLEWILEGGVPVAMLMAVALFGWGRQALRLWNRRREGDGEWRLALAAAAMLFVLGAASLVDYPLRVPSIACVFAIAAVWLAYGVEGRKTSVANEGSKDRTDSPTRAG